MPAPTSVADTVKRLQESWELLFNQPAPDPRKWTQWLLAYNEEIVSQAVSKLSLKYDDGRLKTDDLIKFMPVILSTVAWKASSAKPTNVVTATNTVAEAEEVNGNR